MRDVLARRDGIMPAAIRDRIGRRPIPAANWILLAFPCGTALSALLQRHLLEAPQSAQHLVEFNVGEAFGLAASLSLVLAGPSWSGSLTRSDVAVLLLAALAWFIPEQHAVYLATTLAGTWFLLGGRSDPRRAAIGQIWLALSIYELWAKLFFKVAYQVIEVIEIDLIYRVGRLIYGGLALSGASLAVRGDWSIVILEGCSSFHNLSLAALIWLSILKIAERPVSAAAFRALGLSACCVVAINIARILAMLPSREAYLFWHDGAGSTLVALSSVAAAIVPVLLCVERGACRLDPRP